MKLHLQFGHGSGEKIWKLTEAAQWSDGLNEDEREEVKQLVTKLIATCEVCRRYKRTPAKPVVSFSWSKTFNTFPLAPIFVQQPLAPGKLE